MSRASGWEYGVSGTTDWMTLYIYTRVSVTLAIDRMPRKCVTRNLGLRSGFHLSNGRDGSEVTSQQQNNGVRVAL